MIYKNIYLNNINLYYLKKMKKIKGSSETIRETLLEKNIPLKTHIDLINETILFDFNSYIQNGTPNHKPKPDEKFLQWFIGFFEAEGCFAQCEDNGRQRFKIEISQKDPALMYKIRTQLGFGNVTSFQREITKTAKITKITYWRYQVSSTVNINRFIYLFNGNLITGKRKKQFKLWVEQINSVYQTNHKILHRSLTVSLQTGWLSGFLEGDGGFWASPKNVVYKSKHGSLSYSVRMKFSVTQKDALELLERIKDLFKIPTAIYHHTDGDSIVKYSRLESVFVSCHQQVISYLNKYPFLGQRNILIQRWGRLIRYRTEKYPITEKSIKKLKRLIKSTKNN